ncbi:serine protease inhibitor 28Dc-like isoform X2 [Malaya genurostris]|uniref:serine protease inhibitor 28Dc-like isoform X2 n=1 Tax=Malaya genurostris TaxID=325434 RepID=UPI0026F3E774|nr:serine protease inhibitor 28Dc-like isoform X2 [Malaya genurostris]
MKLTYTLGIVLLVISQHANCQRQQSFASQSDGSTEPSNSNSVDIVANSVTNLAQKISRAIVSQRSKTEIFSPVSIAGALSLLLLGSGGTTRSELMDLMGFSGEQINFTDIHKGFGKLFRELVSNDPSLKANVPWRQNDKCNNVDYDDDDFTSSRGSFPGSAKGSRPRRDAEIASAEDNNTHEIHIANGIFVDDSYNLNPLYDMTAKELYQSEVEKLDFVGRPDEATKRINAWVNESTHGKIPEIFSASVGSNTVMVIASALYFKALWKDMFIEGGTRSREFFPNGKNESSIKVDMMAHGGCFPFYESPDLDARILGIPYEKNLSTMYIIKPNHSNRQVLQEMVAKLDSSTINGMIGRMKMKTAIVLFPKMHISRTLDLKKVMKTLGVRSVFHPGRSELSALSGGSNVQGSASPDLPNPLRPAVNLPIYPRFKNKTKPANPNQLVFSRNEDDKTEIPTVPDTTITDEAEMAPSTTSATNSAKLSNKSLKSKRDVSYKTPTEVKGKPDPLKSKDFFLNKRIVKPTGGKKLRRRSRRATQSLYVNDAIHKVDLEINERGTEGGAATAISLNRSGTSVVFKANEPFLLLIRNDKTKLPIFFGSVYDPSE